MFLEITFDLKIEVITEVELHLYFEILFFRGCKYIIIFYLFFFSFKLWRAGNAFMRRTRVLWLSWHWKTLKKKSVLLSFNWILKNLFSSYEMIFILRNLNHRRVYYIVAIFTYSLCRRKKKRKYLKLRSQDVSLNVRNRNVI